jgi:hypothetical protein
MIGDFFFFRGADGTVLLKPRRVENFFPNRYRINVLNSLLIKLIEKKYKDVEKDIINKLFKI